MIKNLTERFKEIDTGDLENVLTFLYKEDARKYDLTNMADVFELYYFTVYFSTTMGLGNIRRMYLQMGGEEKTPAILQIGNKAIDVISRYSGMKRFTDISVEYEMFYELYRKVYDICMEKVKDGYVCYLKTFPKEKQRDSIHNLYLAQERDFERHFPVIMLQLVDVEDENAVLEIVFDKTATAKSKAKKEKMVITKTPQQSFDMSPIEEVITRRKKNAEKDQGED